MKRYRVFTWHIHGSYLNYLVQSPHDFYLPVKPGRPMGYGGRGHTFTWPDNTYEVPAEEVKDREFDVVLYQHPQNYFQDQYQILSEEQRRLPASTWSTTHPASTPPTPAIPWTTPRSCWSTARTSTA